MDARETQLIDIVETQLIDIVETQLIDIVETQLIDIVETQLIDIVETQLIDIVPDNFEHEIANNLGPGGIIKLAKTSTLFYSFFKREYQLALPLLGKLLNHVVRGNQEEAEKLLRLFPDLLVCKGTVKDYSGRKIEGTALQIALGAEDVKYRDNEECMAEMIERYLKKLPNSEEIIAAQIAEQFPEGWEKKEEERAKNDLIELKKVFAAIAKSTTDDDCKDAVQTFRDYLASQTQEVIKSGKHFNMQLLVEAFELYGENYNDFGGWDSRQNNLCWRKIIGGIQRYLPANYAQAVCQGVYYIVEDNEKLNRSLKFRHDRDVVFYPLDSDPTSRLGYEYAGGAWWWLAGCRGWGLGCALYKTLSNKKQQRCDDLRRNPTIRQRIGAS